MATKWRKLLQQHKLLASAIAGISVVSAIVMLVIARTSKPTQAAPQPPTVEVVQVAQEDVPVYSEWIGTTDGMVNAEIRAQVAGYLLKQDYKEGSLIKKGQLLFEIDSRPFEAALGQASGDLAKAQGQAQQADSQFAQPEAQVAQANSQLQQAQAQVAQAEANQRKTQLDADRYAPLAQQKAVTQQDYDNAVQGNNAARAQVAAATAGVEAARAQVKVANAGVGNARAAIVAAKAQVESSQAAVKTAQVNLGFTRIISPIDGIAGIAQAQVGNLVGPTTSALTTISTVDPIKVYFTLSEQEYLNFTKRNLIGAERGASVQQLELELILADGSIYPQKGTFFVADRQIDQKTGAIRLAGIFPNPGNTLRPGQYGRVRAVTSTRENALLVPQRSITELQGSYQIAVVGNDDKVEVRSVKVGDRVASRWIVEDGLKPGEKVVAEGIQKVKSGLMVSPRPYVAPAADRKSN